MILVLVNKPLSAAGVWEDNAPGGYSLIWVIWGRAAGQGMVFGLAVLNRVYNLTCLCPKQGTVLRAERL